jgi:hypothetical protein
MDDSIQSRMIRAAKLEPELYEEVEADPSTLGQAALVVVLSAAAAGIGNLGEGGLPGLGLSVVAALAGWYVWAFLTYFIGTRLLPEPQTEADHGELLRTLGFASAPGILRVLGVVPGLHAVVFVGTGIWMLVAGVVAVRQALDYKSTPRAVGVCAIGWLLQGFLIIAVLAILR